MKLGVGDAMLITHENILRRFTENLVWATGIDLATAWATSNGGLRALQDRNVSFEVRSVVGLWGTTTTPNALGTLARMGELRVADESRRFHPKVYVFRGEGRSVAWIGSANFTSRGFGGNEEALFETADTEAVESWFDRLWEQCGPLDECTINDGASTRDLLRERYGETLDVVIPPPKNAVIRPQSARGPTVRDRHIAQIRSNGRMAWQAATGYNQRSRIETQIGRWKGVIGPKLKSRSFSRQITEVQLGRKVLNTMTALGRPVFERIS